MYQTRERSTVLAHLFAESSTYTGSSSKSSAVNAEEPVSPSTVRSGPSKEMSEPSPLEEIQVVDRYEQPAQEVKTAQTQRESRGATTQRRSTWSAHEHGVAAKGSNNDNDGEEGKRDEAESEGDAPVDGRSRNTGPSPNTDSSQKVGDGHKLDEEPMMKVLLDALEAKHKPEDPWAKCAKEVWEFEESLVDKWKEDINNLLLFSGLFSTVLTGFTVPFYVTIAASEALIFMSGNLSVVAADVGRTPIANWLIKLSDEVYSSPLQSPMTVVVAVLWFAALILSLGAASVAISINQWLHHHVNSASKTSQRSVQVWFFRRRGLTRWGVEQAVAMLPLLLQFSLVLFLLGLDILLWTLNTTVAVVTTALIILLLMPTTVTSVIPSFSPDSPFKYSQAWWFFRFWRWAMRKLENSRFSPFRGAAGNEYVIRSIWNRCCQVEKWRLSRTLPALGDWRELDNFCMQTLEDDSETKLQMLVEADLRVMDETFLGTVVRPCLQQAAVSEALPAFYKIVDHRAHDHAQDEEHTPIWWASEQDHQAISMSGHMSLDMLDKVASNHMDSGDREEETTHILKLVNSLLGAMPNRILTVYSRLLDVWVAPNLSDEQRESIALLVKKHKFNTNTFQKMLTLLPIARRELSTRQFLRYSTVAFNRAADLLPSDFAQVRKAIRGALATVAGYFSPPAMGSVAQEISQARAWTYVVDVFEAYARLAKNDASLFTKDVVDALAEYAV
ncbi:predicted protein [Postia placenta Mad-698-R]|nr:predicted protein [Postia placenta Mad-698-R]